MYYITEIVFEQIHEEKLSWNVHSKVNSLENAQYTARGGTHRFPFPVFIV